MTIIQQYDIGPYYNWIQVFGKKKLYWPIPIFTRNCQPIGDGIVWPQKHNQFNNDWQKARHRTPPEIADQNQQAHSGGLELKERYSSNKGNTARYRRDHRGNDAGPEGLRKGELHGLLKWRVVQSSAGETEFRGFSQQFFAFNEGMGGKPNDFTPKYHSQMNHTPLSNSYLAGMNSANFYNPGGLRIERNSSNII